MRPMSTADLAVAGVSLPPVMAIGTWRNNAELIADMPRLGYLRDEWFILDPTYGLGRFWTKWRPRNLHASDISPALSPIKPAIDFTKMPWPSRFFDAVVFDPPYKLNGTSTGKGASAADVRYGVTEYAPQADRHTLITDGITECVRVLKVGGTLLIKCQDQVCGGKVRWQTREFADHAESLGCRLVDMLHIQSYRPQPPGRRQQHARRNYSTMLVLRREAAK
jgi:hypothetical protein